MKTLSNKIPVPCSATALLTSVCLCASFTILVAGAKPSDPKSKNDPLSEGRGKQIDNTGKEGKIGALEAEFMKVQTGKYESPQARHEAIRAWRAAKGKALDAEKEAKRASLQPQRDARKAAMLDHRKEQIGKMKEAGKIGANEAEFMSLIHGDYESPQARQDAISSWRENNGAALAAEREQRKASLQPSQQDQAEKMRKVRRQQTTAAVESGRIGPVEGELQVLLTGDFASPQDKQEALRKWMEEKRAALEAERAARRTTNP